MCVWLFVWLFGGDLLGCLFMFSLEWLFSCLLGFCQFLFVWFVCLFVGCLVCAVVLVLLFNFFGSLVSPFFFFLFSLSLSLSLSPCASLSQEAEETSSEGEES